MKDRNFVKEIEKLKTAVLGYDREEVVLYIKELVDYYEKKNGDAVKELYLEKMRLIAENSGLKSQVSTQEEIYAELAARMDRINQSVEKRGEIDSIQDSELEHYRSNEEALRNMAGEAKEHADAILRHAQESANAIMNNANIEKERVLSEAAIERRKILKEADEKQKEILAEAGRQMDVILVKTREKVEKEQALYYQYRNRLEVLKNGLDNIFAECPPEGDIQNPQKQPTKPEQIPAENVPVDQSPVQQASFQKPQEQPAMQEQSSGDSGQIQTGDLEEIQIEEINLQEQP